MTKTTKCKECKQKFTPKSLRNKWCSKKCYRSEYYRIRANRGDKSECLYCKKEYRYAHSAKMPRRKFCSVLCSTQYFKLKNRECPVCDKMFKPKRSTTIHCSVECANSKLPIVKCTECGEPPSGKHAISYARRKENRDVYLCKKCKFYDFETHKELALHSGCNDSSEWIECGARGFLPERIRTRPDVVVTWNDGRK